MPKNTGFLPPSWRSALWVSHRLTERDLLDSAEYLPADLRKEFQALMPAAEPDMAKIDRLAALCDIALQNKPAVAEAH